MKGVVINKTGGVEVLEYKTDLPLPELKDGQVLIKNDFIGVNYIDTYGQRETVLSYNGTCLLTTTQLLPHWSLPCTKDAVHARS